MKNLALVGGIGVGKSTVANIFKVLNVPVFEADKEAKYLIDNNLELRKSLINLFGENTFDLRGKYNTTYVAALVFEQPELKKQLNTLVHPLVNEAYQKWILKHKASPYTLKEMAILNEPKNYWGIIWLSSPLELRIRRILGRDPHRTEADIRNIIAAQQSDIFFKENSSFEIKNNEKDSLISQVLKIDKTLKLSV